MNAHSILCMYMETLFNCLNIPIKFEINNKNVEVN